jgi:hypothetical protein
MSDQANRGRAAVQQHGDFDEMPATQGDREDAYVELLADVLLAAEEDGLDTTKLVELAELTNEEHA